MRSEEELAELTKIAQQLEEELDRWDRWQWTGGMMIMKIEDK